MNSTYVVLTIVCVLLAVNDVENDIEGDPRESLNMDNAAPIICLVRVENNTRKGEAPLLQEYKGFGNVALNILIHDTNIQWFRPQLCIPQPLEQAEQLFQSEWYSKDVPSIMILPDRCLSGFDATTTNIIKAMSLRKLHLYYNIFVFDEPGFECDTVTKIYNTVFRTETDFKVALKVLVSFFDKGITINMIQPDQINFIGMGLAAQLAGKIAIKLGRKINSIVGLDPSKMRPYPHVKKTHADVVQLYHCTVTHDLARYKSTRSGKTDFYFSRVSVEQQDICEGLPKQRCLHEICFDIFVGVVLLPSRFQAWKCRSMKDFTKEDEDCNGEHTFISYPPNGESQGIYYLRVNPRFPYGVGADGRKFDRKTIITNEFDVGEGIQYDPTWFYHMTPDELLKSGLGKVHQDMDYLNFRTFSSSDSHTDKVEKSKDDQPVAEMSEERGYKKGGETESAEDNTEQNSKKKETEKDDNNEKQRSKVNTADEEEGDISISTIL